MEVRLLLDGHGRLLGQGGKHRATARSEDNPAGCQSHGRGGLAIVLWSSRTENSSAPRARGNAPHPLLSGARAQTLSRQWQCPMAPDQHM